MSTISDIMSTISDTIITISYITIIGYYNK